MGQIYYGNAAGIGFEPTIIRSWRPLAFQLSFPTGNEKAPAVTGARKMSG
jgi:hypothetical protein